MQVYILMQSAGAPAGLLGRPPKTQTSAAGQCAGRRSGSVPFQGSVPPSA